MLQSMTGYGEATSDNSISYIHATIKTLNSKHLDIQFNLPKLLIPQEAIWRKLFSKHLQRGNVTLEIIYLRKKVPIQSFINESLLKEYYHALKDIAEELNAKTDLLGHALKATKNTNHITSSTLSKNQLFQIHQTVEKALKQCITNRQKEAKQLHQQIIQCLELLRTKLLQIDQHTPERNLALRNKLKEKITLRETSSTLDPYRWEQEILYYLEKLDIEEEKTRLHSHHSYFLETLKNQGPIGKKLNFITQEIGRELNTIASKAQNIPLQHLVVEMKQSLEQIKEQLQNLV